MKILKSTDTNEEAKSGNLFVLLLGCLLIPTGIGMFFTLQNIGGLLYTLLAFVGMAAAVWGIYILIIQLASIGDILKRHKSPKYYKEIVFYNLLRQKIRQYTKSIFVATLLIFFTVFGIGFIAAGFIDGYNVAINEPFDYTISTSADRPEITEQQILSLAEESGTTITELYRMDVLLLGVENIYKSGDTDWGTRVIVSADKFNTITAMNIHVPKGTYTLYYDSCCPAN